MKIRVLLACTAGLVVLSPSGAHAAAEAGQWETDLGVAFTNSSNADFEGGTKADFDSDTGLRLGFGYHYTENLQLGATFGMGTRDYKLLVAGDNGASFSA